MVVLFFNDPEGISVLVTVEEWILGNLQVLFDQFGWWGVAGMMAFENATGITPSEVILGFAGWMLLAAHRAPLAMIFLGGLYATLGSVLGASLTYWVARLGGRPVVYRVARWVRIDAKHIENVEEKFRRWGTGFVLFGRVVPGARTLVSIPAGLAKMSYPVFLLATTAGAYVWCTLLIALGFWLGSEWTVISQYVKQFAPWIVTLAAVAGLAFWYIQARRSPVPVIDPELDC
jgi:membrane protein DedA with SNARE-associated domain